ncbi:MAG: hypothetical protein QOE93_267 [Actinomycetota bacterium]|jgi:post-segregation antitoxin (ccd killing protein)|nr:hypothetical protein [Actinomycetota bacterium]
MPGDLYVRAREAGLNISRLTQRAIAAELDRLSKVAALDAYLAELEAELGPIGDAERAEAAAWADRVLGPEPRRHSA